MQEDIFDPQLITEGFRFGKEQRSALLARKSDFRIGLEFEFNVNDGESFIDTMLGGGTSTDKNRKKLVEEASGYVDVLTENIVQLRKIVKSRFENIDELSDVAETYQDIIDTGDYEEAEIEKEYSLPAVMVLVPSVIKIVSASEKLQKAPHTDALIGYGMWGGESGDRYSFALQNISRNSDIDLLSSEETYRLIGDLVVFVSGLVGYLEELDDMLVDNISAPQLTVQMLHLLEQNAMNNEPDVYGTGSEVNTSAVSKIDIVKQSHPLPKNWVQGIVPDPTVADGAELVTIPLSLDNTYEALKRMEAYIDEVGDTASNTGLHVNVSIRDNSKIKLPKAITMLDVDFFQNMSPSGRKVFKYDPRILVSQLYRQLAPSVVQLAQIYLDGGSDALVEGYETLLLSKMTKDSSVNAMQLLFNADSSQQRIEFRFFGGEGYHKRTDEIFDDIQHVLYAILASTDETFERKVYLRNIVRILDRVTAMSSETNALSFTDLIQSLR